MISKQEWALGDRVRSECQLVRVANWSHPRGGEKKWREFNDPVEGVLVGTRTYQDGVLVMVFDEDNSVKGMRWERSGHREVALVATRLRGRPIPVPLERLERVE